MENIDAKGRNTSFLENSAQESGNLEVAGEFVLPEHLDDAKKIVRCDSMLRPGSKYIDGGDVEYEGEIVYSVLYLTDSNSLKNAVFKTTYSHKFHVGENAGEMSVRPESAGLDCKLINMRKISIKSYLRLNFLCLSEHDTLPAVNGDKPDKDDCTCEKKTDTESCLDIISGEKKDLRMSRDFELNSSSGEAREIICCTVETGCCDISTSGMNVVYSCPAIFKCLYLIKNDGENEYGCAEFSFTIDGKANSSRECDGYTGAGEIFISELTVSVSKNSRGEARVFEIDLTYGINFRLYKNLECTFVTDAYSCDYNCSLKYSDVELIRVCAPITAKGDFTSSSEFSHFGDIIYPCAHASFHGVHADGDDSYADTDVRVSAVVKSEDARLSVIENNVTLKLPIDIPPSCDRFICRAYVTDVAAVYNGQNVEISGNVHIRCIPFARNEKKFLSEIAVDKTKPRDDLSALPITFYYPEDGEELWDIARRYGSTEEYIRDANELGDGTKIGKNVLLIPRKRKKPLFSKII